MKKYSPTSLYKNAHKWNDLICQLSELFERKLIKQSMDTILYNKKIENAKGRELDRIGDKIGVIRPIMVDDTSTKYVVTQEVSDTFLDSQKGEIYFPLYTDKSKAGVVFFNSPIGDKKKSSDSIYKKFLFSYIHRTYRIYSHNEFINVLKIFLNDKTIELSIDGRKISIKVRGTLSPIEISYFNAKLIPLSLGRVIVQVSDDNEVVYSDKHYIELDK